MATDPKRNTRPGKLSRRQLLALAPAGLLSSTPAWLAGCGGGGDDGRAPITDEQRHAVLDGLGTAIARATDQSNAGKNAAADAYFALRPEFASHGISEGGGTWAKFTDGRLVVTAFNRLAATAAQQQSLTERRNARPLAVTPGFTGLASTNQALLMNTLQPPEYQPATKNIADLLQSRGYGTLPVSPCGVEDWKELSGISVVSVESHGTLVAAEAVAGQPARDISILLSGTRATAALDVQYKADLDAQVLTYFSTRDDASDSWVNNYGLTSSFFDRYALFDRNSIVFLNACLLGHPRADMLNVLVRKGAGVAVGWTSSVADASAFDTGLFFYDRLLGTNTVPPLDPLDYPLSVQELLTALAETIDPMTQLPFDTSASDPRTPHARLRVALGAGTTLGGLVPSIRGAVLGAAGAGSARLSGLFGETEGNATEYDADNKPVRELTIMAWSGSTVDVKVLATTRHLGLSVNGARGNIVEFGSTVSLDPATASLRKGSELTLTATTPVIAGGSVRYHWTVTGGGGATLTESPVGAGSQVGAEFDSSHNVVLLKTRYTTTGPLAITVQGFSAVGATTSPLGSARCVVTMTDPVIVLTPALARIDSVGGSQVFTVGATPPLVAPAGRSFRYEWFSPFVEVGNLTLDMLIDGPTTGGVISGSPVATLKGKDGLIGGEVGTVTCRVFYVDPPVAPSVTPVEVNVSKYLKAQVEVKAPFAIAVNPASADVPTDSSMGVTAFDQDTLPEGSTAVWEWSQTGVGSIETVPADSNPNDSSVTFKTTSAEGTATVTARATFTIPATATKPSRIFITDPVSTTLNVKKGLKTITVEGYFQLEQGSKPSVPPICGLDAQGKEVCLLGHLDTWGTYIVPKVANAESYLISLIGTSTVSYAVPSDYPIGGTVVQDGGGTLRIRFWGSDSPYGSYDGVSDYGITQATQSAGILSRARNELPRVVAVVTLKP